MPLNREKHVTELDDENEKTESKLSYYQILAVPENAQLKDIKTNFRKLAIDFHPDNQKTGDAHLFALVARAYECLSDSEKRAEYDKMLLIEKKTKKSNYLSQKKAFEDFLKAQDTNPESKKGQGAKSKFSLEYDDLDRKRGFDRKKYDEEKDNKLTDKETSKKYEDLLLAREQDAIELTQRQIFTEDTWNPDKFNEIFELKYKKGNDKLVKHTGMPSAFNEMGGHYTTADYDELFDDRDDGADTEYYSSMKQFEEGEYNITDEDMKRIKSMKGARDYTGHNRDRSSKSYQDELNKRIKERDQEDELYNNRKIKDFETDNKMGGYGFLHQVGLTGKELEYDDDEIDDEAMRKLIEYRKAEEQMSKRKPKRS